MINPTPPTDSKASKWRLLFAFVPFLVGLVLLLAVVLFVAFQNRQLTNIHVLWWSGHVGVGIVVLGEIVLIFLVLGISLESAVFQLRKAIRKRRAPSE